MSAEDLEAANEAVRSLPQAAGEPTLCGQSLAGRRLPAAADPMILELRLTGS